MQVSNTNLRLHQYTNFRIQSGFTENRLGAYACRLEREYICRGTYHLWTVHRVAVWVLLRLESIPLHRPPFGSIQMMTWKGMIRSHPLFECLKLKIITLYKPIKKFGQMSTKINLQDRENYPLIHNTFITLIFSNNISCCTSWPRP